MGVESRKISLVLAEEFCDGHEITLADSLRDSRGRTVALALQATSIRVAEYTNGRAHLPATSASSG